MQPEMPDVGQFLHSSAVLGSAVTLGNLAIWLGLASAVAAVACYWTAMLRDMRQRREAEALEDPESAPKKGGRRATAGMGGPLSAADRKTARITGWGRRFFCLTSACVILGSLSLWTLIFGEQYTVHYVWKNSNHDLPFGYRFASFWSDQEGTFFLWALYNVVFGAVLLWKAREDERWVMPFFTLINVSLFSLLTFMNPFWMVSPDAVRDQLEKGLQSTGQLTPEQITHTLAFLPKDLGQHLAYYFGWARYWKITDGNGLNESLQNFWMVIHPPTLFVGFSSMVIPACFALGALMKRDYDTWTNRATPWLMFSWTILGTGIFLGAYWAYETLGWGGYWSWDPVENSSLLPWLMGTTLLHGMLAQRNRGNFKQANLFLGIMTGATVLLSSFLNRSGVLGEVSVHSFATPQAGVFWTLLLIMVLWFLMSTVIWFSRFKEIQAEIAYETVWERHFGFFLGLIVLSATTLVVMFGVTAPVWMPKIGLKLNIEYTFYNKALLPVAFVMVVLMTLTPLMPWRRAREESRPQRPFNVAVLGLAAVFSIFFVFAALWAFVGGFRTQNDPAYVAFGLILALGLVANTVCLLRAARGGIMMTGGWLAHIGFMVMLGGIILTSRFNSVHPVSNLETGDSVQLLGRKFTFMGGRRAANELDHDRMLVRVEKDGKTWDLDPKVFISRKEPEPGKPPNVMAWPQIVHEWFGGLWGDLYIEPSGTVGTSGVATLDGVAVGAKEPSITTVRRKKTDPEELVSLRLTDWKPPKDAAPGAAPSMVADVDVTVNGHRQKVQARMEIGERGFEPQPVTITGQPGGTSYALLFTGVDPTTRTGKFAIVPEDPIEVGSFQVLHVPGIQVLWFGCYIMFTGGWICYRRRAMLAGKPVTAKAPATAKPSRRAQAEQAPEPAGAE